jgi:hypothetical protein
MATTTRPFLTTGVALASAAAIVVATPTVAPSFSVPAPGALSTAAYELTTFSDVLSVPTYVWTDLLFGNSQWGNVLGPQNLPDSRAGYGPDFAAPQDQFGQPSYVNPWSTFCNYGCAQFGSQPGGGGLPAVAYLFFDALVNGDGNGFDADNPTADGQANWNIGLVNYLFEPFAAIPLGGGNSPSIQISRPGFSAATWFALQATLGQALPELQVPIASLFWGEFNLTVAFNAVAQIAATLVSQVPLVGPFIGNSIFAYLGDLQIPGGGFYQYGLSGILNYWVDIATGSVPFPAASVLAASAAAPAAAEVTAATDAVADEVTDAPGASDPVGAESSPAEAAPAGASEISAESAPVEVSEPVAETAPVEVTEVSEPVAETAPVEVTEVSEPVAETAPVEVTEVSEPVAETAPVEVNAPAVGNPSSAAEASASTAPAETAVKAPKRPLRGAAERAVKKITSAVGGTKAGAATSASADAE